MMVEIFYCRHGGAKKMKKTCILLWITTVSLFFMAASMVLPARSFAGGSGGQQDRSSQVKPDPERFETVFDGTAVLDKETGFVWEKSPEPESMSWNDAASHCESLELAGRKQWHLPTLDELVSLVDSSVLGSPKLPRTHPFDTGCRLGGCVQSNSYWTTTPGANNADYVWLICFCNGSETQSDKSYENFVWCTQAEKSDETD